MRLFLRGLVPLAAAFVLAAMPPAARAEDFGDAEFIRFRDAFQELSLDTLHAFRARSVLIERPFASFAMDDGLVAFTGTIGRGGRAALYVGPGTFTFTPEHPVEREQLRRAHGTPSLRIAMRSVTFFYTDSTGRELESVVQPDDAPMPARAARTFTDSRRYLLRDPREGMHRSAALALLEAPAPGWLWARVVDAKGDSYFFTLDPWDAERAQLLRPTDYDQFGLFRVYASESLCQLAVPGDTMPERDERPNVVVDSVRLRLDFDEKLGSRGHVTYAVRGVAPSSRWMPLVLPGFLEIDSVRVGDAPPRAMTYPRRTFREREVHTWWVDLGAPLAAGERRVLRIAYHGDVLERQRVMVRRDSEVRRAPEHTLGRLHGAEREEEWIVLRHPLFWYPYPLFSNRAAWDLTFRVPRRYPLVASGELVSEHDEGDGHVSRWVTRDPAYLASFYVGFLRGVEVSDAALRPLRAWFHSPSQSGRRETLTTAELADARGTEESVARDIARAVKFYTESFGPPRVTALNAVESPDRVYLAFPGLVHMMRKIDQRTPGLEHSTDYVRAHELAHQWWGYGVTPRTYHDVWLNEAFADFSALWYVQAGRGDVNSYLQILRSMRQSLMDSRRSVLGTNQEAGPIWLGPRNESSRTPGDYQLVTYKKGAWVLHMLRNLMVDVQSGDDTPFRQLMRDFYQRHVGGLATTEDFRAAAERAMDQDLGWFFDQWVYGTEEPRYRVTWRPVRTPEGQWAVKLVVHQSGVHERFRMPVLVRLEFEGGQYARARVWVNGPVTELTLPATALEPQRIAFNDLESVLCQVESVKKE